MIATWSERHHAIAVAASCGSDRRLGARIGRRNPDHMRRSTLADCIEVTAERWTARIVRSGRNYQPIYLFDPRGHSAGRDPDLGIGCAFAKLRTYADSYTVADDSTRG